MRSREAGQVGVETALVMPFSIFMILGIMQLSMMQQARLLAEYAAYRAVRAGSVNQVACNVMIPAADQAILPSFGRTDTALELGKTWLGNSYGSPVGNIYLPLPLPLIRLKYVVTADDGAPASPYTAQDFDDPDHPLTLTAELTYNYELRIPFANMMIHEMWTGSNYFSNKADELVPASKRSNVDALFAGRKATHMADAAKYHLGSRYFVPLRTSSSMRMMSNLPAGASPGYKGTCQ